MKRKNKVNTRKDADLFSEEDDDIFDYLEKIDKLNKEQLTAFSLDLRNTVLMNLKRCKSQQRFLKRQRKENDKEST